MTDTEEIRESYQIAGDGADFKRRFFERGEVFDAWLRKVKADAWAEGRDSAHWVSFEGRFDDNPYL